MQMQVIQNREQIQLFFFFFLLGCFCLQKIRTERTTFFFFFFFTKQRRALSRQTACKDLKCGECFDMATSANCEFCDQVGPGRMVCMDKGQCNTGSAFDFDSVVPVSKRFEVCGDDPCNKFGCNDCFGQSAQCVWCSGTFTSKCRSIAACTDTKAKPSEQAAKCGDPCEDKDCNACFADSSCKMCTLFGNYLKSCKAVGGSCPTTYSARNSTEKAAVCGAVDPCSKFNADCQGCLSDSNCRLCGYGKDQICEAKASNNGKCTAAPLRTSCALCPNLDCNACTAEPACSYCKYGYGVTTSFECETGAQCTDFAFSATKITSAQCKCTPPIAEVNKAECAVPTPQVDKCRAKNQTCSACVDDPDCDWCVSPGNSYGDCAEKCYPLIESPLTDKSKCDDVCAHLDCASCKTNSLCAWCGPPIASASCTRRSGNSTCPLAQFEKTCSAPNVNDPKMTVPPETTFSRITVAPNPTNPGVVQTPAPTTPAPGGTIGTNSAVDSKPASAATAGLSMVACAVVVIVAALN
jgi:hypothetical protein